MLASTQKPYEKFCKKETIVLPSHRITGTMHPREDRAVEDLMSLTTTETSDEYTDSLLRKSEIFVLSPTKTGNGSRFLPRDPNSREVSLVSLPHRASQEEGFPHSNIADSFSPILAKKPENVVEKGKLEKHKEEEEDIIGTMPEFPKQRIKRNDPRRQSTAIFSQFERSMHGAGGLLDDEELALGDEDILISLKNANKLASLGANTLWVDPNNDDYLQHESIPELALDDVQSQENKSAQNDDHYSLADSIALLHGFSLSVEGAGSLEDIGIQSEVEAFLWEKDCIETKKFDPNIGRDSHQSRKVKGDESKRTLKEMNGELQKGMHPRDGIPPKPTSIRPSRLKPPSTASNFFGTTSSTADGNSTSRYAEVLS